MKRFSLFFLIAPLMIVGVLLSCNFPNQPDNPEQQQDTIAQDTVPAKLEKMQATMPIVQNWVFDKRPIVRYDITNPNSVEVTTKLKVHFYTDKGKDLGIVEQSALLPAKGKKQVDVTGTKDFAPGFYRAVCMIDEKVTLRFYFGVNPYDIVSAPDKQEDFDTFWEDAKQQLKAVDMQAELTEIPSKSNANCKAYLVEMKSIADGTSGEPVTVRGYYLEPTDGKKHPVLMHYYGYDTYNKPPKVVCPTGSGKYAEFYLSHRGQYINYRTADNRTPDGKGDFENIYGDWFAYEFGHKDSYYYRGAFMDCVQAVRFMATRETSDTTNLFAEGSSQGGALCYAAAALSDIPFTAIAPNVAFLGDYPDYFEIVSWPAEVAKAHQGSMTDSEMYAFLSYFDTKNLATRISCAVWATSGLQDRTCPPHTNMAPFNNLKSTDKTMNFYPEMQHAYPSSWYSDIEKFFQARMK